jgi:hypothetical protein
MSTFDEQAYLAANPDVAAAVAKGTYKSGYDHYKDAGAFENRALDPSGRTDPTARWRYGDVHWTKDIDPEGAQRLYDEIVGITGRLPEDTQKQLWSSPGFGMRDKNMQAMVGDLYRKGVRSLSDLQVDARPIMEQTGLVVRADGSAAKLDDRGEYTQEVPLTPAEFDALKSTPEYQKALEQIRSDRLGEMGGRAQVTASLPTGKQTGNLINRHTGEIVSAKNRGETLEKGFGISRTAAGKGKTNFMLFPVPVQGPDGQTTYQFVPGTTNTATGLNKFMQDFGPVIGAASLLMGLPGVAAGMGTAGTVANIGLRGLTAANAFNNGANLAGIASLAGMAPGLNAVGNLGLSADTLNTIKNVGTVANIGQAVQDKNPYAALGGAANLAGIRELGGVDVNQGLGALSALDRGDNLAALLSGLGAAGQQTIPGTSVETRDASDALNVYRNVRSGDPRAMLRGLSALNRDDEPRGPQAAVKRAAGGRIPPLSKYMTAGV